MVVKLGRVGFGMELRLSHVHGVEREVYAAAVASILKLARESSSRAVADDARQEVAGEVAAPENSQVLAEIVKVGHDVRGGFGELNAIRTEKNKATLSDALAE